MCSVDAYRFALQLKEQYDKEQAEEKSLNVETVKDIAKDTDAKRQVGEIDYAKHEQTIKNLEREDELAEYKAKALDAATWCPLDHEHGPNCVRPRGDCSHNHQKEIAIYERSTEEKIRAAAQFRESGNKLFKEENYGLACVEYRRGLLQYDYTFPEGEEEDRLVEEGKLALYSNLAWCKIQLDEYDEALTCCRCALKCDPKNCKVLYRKGLAHMGKLDFDDAKKCFLAALEVEPSNESIRRALHEVHAQMEKYREKTRRVAEHVINAPEKNRKEEMDEEVSVKSKTELEEKSTSSGTNDLKQSPAPANESSEGSVATESDEDAEVDKIHEEWSRRRAREKEDTSANDVIQTTQRSTPPLKVLDTRQKMILALIISCVFFACATIFLSWKLWTQTR